MKGRLDCRQPVTARLHHVTIFYLDEAHPRGRSPRTFRTRFMGKVRVMFANDDVSHYM